MILVNDLSDCVTHRLDLQLSSIKYPPFAAFTLACYVLLSRDVYDGMHLDICRGKMKQVSSMLCRRKWPSIRERH